MCEFSERKHIAANYLTVIEICKYRKKALRNFFTQNDHSVIYGDNFLKNLDTDLRKEGKERLMKNRARMDNISANIADNCYLLTLQDEKYPPFLKDLVNPPPVLFAIGNLNYLFKPSFAVVGTRSATENGIKRAKKIAYFLTKEGFVIVSGLAKGIDRAAHESAIKNYGKTIAVIGTPLDKYYPRENKELQNVIARDHLLISQFPFGYQTQRYSFVDRNYTMMGLSLATIVVEAVAETSGALTQAKMAIQQKRKAFLLGSLFDRGLDWPEKLCAKGAQRIDSIDDVRAKINEVLKVFKEKNKPLDIKFKPIISSKRSTA